MTNVKRTIKREKKWNEEDLRKEASFMTPNERELVYLARDDWRPVGTGKFETSMKNLKSRGILEEDGKYADYGGGMLPTHRLTEKGKKISQILKKRKTKR